MKTIPNFRVRNQTLRDGSTRHYPEVERHLLWVYSYWTPLSSNDIGDEFTGPIMVEQYYNTCAEALIAIHDYISEHYSPPNQSSCEVVREDFTYYLKG